MAMTFTVAGRLAADPEVSFYGPANRPRVTLTVASDPDYRGAPTDFFRVAVFGDNVAAVRDGHKGDPVTASGEARRNVWETDDGEKRYDIGFVAHTVTLNPPPPADSAAPRAERAPDRAAAAGR